MAVILGLFGAIYPSFGAVVGPKDGRTELSHFLEVGVLDEPAYNEISASVGMVACPLFPNDPSFGSYGSAILIRPGDHILTSAHNLLGLGGGGRTNADNCTFTSFRDWKRAVYLDFSAETTRFGLRTSTVTLDPRYDWAIVKLQAAMDGGVAFAPKGAASDKLDIVIVSPFVPESNRPKHGAEPFAQMCIAQRISDPLAHNGQIFATDCTGRKGMSGSPVFERTVNGLVLIGVFYGDNSNEMDGKAFDAVTNSEKFNYLGFVTWSSGSGQREH